MNTLNLTSAQRRSLRAAAHHLEPVVALGQQGLSAAVLREINRSLQAHELIKVKLHGLEREVRQALQEEICVELECAPVQHIGNILILWRPNPEKQAAAPAAKKPRKAAPLSKKRAASALENKRRVSR